MIITLTRIDGRRSVTPVSDMLLPLAAVRRRRSSWPDMWTMIRSEKD